MTTTEIKPGTDSAMELYTQEHGPEGCDWGNREALLHAVESGWSVNKYTDPTEGAREGLTVDEALEVASEDARLLWLSRDGGDGDAMTEQDAIEYVRGCGEDEGPDSYGEAAEIFAAIFGRAAEPEDGDQFALWSQSCAAVA